MNNPGIVDMLNNLELADESYGEDESYMLVDITDEVVNEFEAWGYVRADLEKYGDEDSFCVLAFAADKGYANYVKGGKLIPV